MTEKPDERNATMFETNKLEHIFQSKYDAAVWRDVLIKLFGAKEGLRADPEKLDVSTPHETAYYLGSMDAPGAKIGFFQYKINKGSVVHKRVGLRKLVNTFVNYKRGFFDAALAVFDDGKNWRVSFISDIKGEATAPKRYTFVFGDATQGYHTAVERFSKLQRDGISLKTLLEAFSVETLTKEFYKELFDWYQWALSGEVNVTYPNTIRDDKENRTLQEHLIRLITRLMFVWFIKQKKLIPESIFDYAGLKSILNKFNPASKTQGNYYNAILQNLFFATLNRPINERKFATDRQFQGKDEHYGIKNLFRDNKEESWFKVEQNQILDIFKCVPFLNGGLFECLDKETGESTTIDYFDGFSRETKKRAFLPNCLFFGLCGNGICGNGFQPLDNKNTTNGKDAVATNDGILSILKRYNFTIEENTPNDVDVALDPELLGKVFENLLGTYNPETSQTARKESGSFYTPREIVNYMVDESLKAYLCGNGIPAVEVEHVLSGNSLCGNGISGNGFQPLDSKAITNGISGNGIPAVEKQPDGRDAVATHAVATHDVASHLTDLETTFFNPYDEIDIHNGDLPHWQQKDVWYFITFRLADSLPPDVVEKIKTERQAWLKRHDIHNLTQEEKIEYYRLFSKRTEDILNAGHGSCALKDPEISKLVENALLHFNNQRYVLDEYVIMPNHVHILVKPTGDTPLPSILHTWKSFTASEINKKLGRSGPFWMKESYDHIVRNDKAFAAFRKYIRNNPTACVATASLPLDSQNSPTACVATACVATASLPSGGFPTAGMPLPHTTLPHTMLPHATLPHTVSSDTRSRIYKALLACKILDPACGSGAFPMGVLNRVICIMENLGLPSHRSIFDLKLHLIKHCIFGVDIQTIAVQISKLRFFISLIVEQTPTQDANDNYGIKSLPNLETQFVAANTLIGLTPKHPQGDLFEDPQIEVTKKSLSEVRQQHFSADTAKKKKECRAEDKRLRNKLITLLEANDMFAPEDAKQLSQWNPYDQKTSSPFFDPEWMFGIKDGFDIVLGNPPYVQLQKNGGELSKLYGPRKEEKKTIPSAYQTFDSMGDIYCLFYERGYQLLSPQGRLCFITSNKWMRAGYGENTRNFFAENTSPEQLIDFAGVKVFESATVDTNILMFSKDKNRQQTMACTVKQSGIENLSVYVSQHATPQGFGAGSWVILSPIERSIKEKIEAVGTPLKDWDIQINYGIKTGYNEAFIISGEKRKELIEQDPKSDEIIRPILRGRDIKRYGYDFADLWLINTHNGIKEKGINPIDINDYPAIKKHLDKYWKEIEHRADQGDTPYNLRNCAYMDDFSKQKIVWIELVDKPNFVVDDTGIMINNTVFFITGDAVLYLTAYLNSSLCNWQFGKICATSGAGTRRWIKMYIEQIKIPQICEEKQGVFDELVLKIQCGKLCQQDVSDYDRKIDKLIYNLYDLSDTEITYINNSQI